MRYLRRVCNRRKPALQTSAYFVFFFFIYVYALRYGVQNEEVASAAPVEQHIEETCHTPAPPAVAIPTAESGDELGESDTNNSTD